MNSFLHQNLLLSLLVASLAITSSLLAQPDQILPLDPQITIGKLENGLTYYIRENSEPENRAAFRLVIKAGSILEKDGTEGLAHFLEHMAFNGTKNFEKQELVEFIEGIGMQFGADLNAYTSFDETVYMLEIPMDDEEILTKTFQILEDWAHNISFDPEEIQKERGVVLEEWRLRLGAGDRIQDLQLPVLFNGSQYADRLPIGYPEIIETVDRDAFVDFYNNYYRPNLMALIAVGDFETEKMESLIRRQFSHLKNPEDGRPRTEFEIPGHTETLSSIATDPELSSTSVSINYKRAKKTMKTEGDYRRVIAESLYSTMLNGRLRERGEQKNPPYLRGSIRKSGFIGPLDMVSQSASVEEGKFAEGLKTVLLEHKRAKAGGFTESELSRAKSNLLRSYQQSFRERDQRRSSSHAGELTSHFLEDEPVPGIEFELNLVERILPTLSLDVVNHIADDWITETNRVILYSAPEKNGVPVPTEADILAVVKEAENTSFESYEEADLSSPLLKNEPRAGKIVKELHHEEVDVTEWTLSNGVRVVLKKTDFKNDQIIFTSFSPGGHSLVDDADFVSAQSASQTISGSGLGDYDALDLRKKLAGKRAQVRPSIGELYENLGGSASPEDLETLFQLIYLRFTEPRTDEDSFGAMLTQLRTFLVNRLNDPRQVYSDAVEKKLFNDHPRHQPLNQAYIDSLDLQKSLEIYKDRFADASDFTFIFVGAFDYDTVRPLTEKYLASLPNLDRKETWRDIMDTPIRGQNEVVVHKGLEPKSSVQLRFYGDADWSYQENYVLSSMIDVIEIPLREALREDKGGVYGVGVSGGLSRDPKGTFSSSIRFGCNPDKVVELIEAAREVVRKMQTDGPDPDDLAAIKEQQIRGQENDIKENGFWMSALSTYTRYDIDFNAINQRIARTEALTAKMIQDAAIKYFDDSNYFVSKLLPEK
ncbi:MAG: insulinase family protein [Verrucomicrobia bacterium]|nr:insulinase family protein [Verrucomicrobiota bacterium]MDA1067332.1 insulinase family protein [Verrucomicrobiota bacterium]